MNDFFLSKEKAALNFIFSFGPSGKRGDFKTLTLSSGFYGRTFDQLGLCDNTFFPEIISKKPVPFLFLDHFRLIQY